jgi:predicted glycosyltransferase
MRSHGVSVLIWVTHVLGIGHYRRIMGLAQALADEGMAPVVASGGAPVPGALPPGVRLEQLPWVRSADNGYVNLVDESGEPAGEAVFDERKQRLADIYRRLRPAAVITELYPFGRRRFATEVDHLVALVEATSPKPLLVCSVRDILQPPSAGDKAARIREKATAYDAILVHGDPALVRIEQSMPLAKTLADRVHYTGYMMEAARQTEPPPGGGEGEVLVSAGGGAVGHALLRAAAEARSLTAARAMTWRFLVGHNMPVEAAEALRALAGDGVIIEPARQDFPQLLRRARLSISQAGYNTCVDLLAARLPGVLVPFAGPDGKEVEQPMRARIFDERGLGVAVDPDRLAPDVLAAAVDRALAIGRPDEVPVSLDGASQSARIIAGLLEGQ